MTEPTWKSLFEKYGMPVQQASGTLSDPFYTMAQQARMMESQTPSSSISLTLSTASDDYSKQRLTVSITCPCPSTEAHIQFITEAAFIVARRMVNDGADALGLPRLGE